MQLKRPHDKRNTESEERGSFMRAKSGLGSMSSEGRIFERSLCQQSWGVSSDSKGANAVLCAHERPHDKRNTHRERGAHNTPTWISPRGSRCWSTARTCSSVSRRVSGQWLRKKEERAYISPRVVKRAHGRRSLSRMTRKGAHHSNVCANKRKDREEIELASEHHAPRRPSF